MENEISLLNKPRGGVKMTLSKINRPTWSRAKDIDISKMKQGNAGIIPFALDENGIAKFCFGVCSKSGELMELGGKRENGDINIENTALRCCREETLGIFNISKKTLRNTETTLYLYDETDLVIFVQVPFDTLGLEGFDLFQKFNEYNTKKESPRVRALTWIHELEISSIITFFNPQMSLRLRCLLRDVAKCIPILKGSDPHIADRSLAPSVSPGRCSPSIFSEVDLIEPVEETVFDGVQVLDNYTDDNMDTHPYPHQGGIEIHCN